MIPLKDDLPTRRFPALTVALIALNVVIFLLGLAPDAASTGQVRQNDVWAMEYGVYPCEVFERCISIERIELPTVDAAGNEGPAIVVQVDEQPAWLTLVTSAFLHGGWMHLIFNMLFLWVFGNNVEDSMSRPAFAVFYLGGAIVAALAQSLVDTSSQIPLIGASGAIAATIGGYLLLYPRVRILTLVPFIFIGMFLRIPAVIVAGAWGLIQFFATTASLYNPTGEGGVAYMAHLAGFVAGMLVIRLFAREKNPYYEALYRGG